MGFREIRNPNHRQKPCTRETLLIFEQNSILSDMSLPIPPLAQREDPIIHTARPCQDPRWLGVVCDEVQQIHPKVVRPRRNKWNAPSTQPTILD